ncbi:MAG: hypothetical protein P4L53_09305 [Candidatus Obscuribacterales bacterium]|nr:hypothetical protein [Candidatus Obscuribacterales bacterium]
MNKLLNWFTTAGGAIGRYLPVSRAVPAFNHDTLVKCEQGVLGVLLAFVLGLVGRYLPFYITPAVLVVAAGGAYYLGRKFAVASLTFLTVAVLYYFLVQPAIVLVLCALLAVLAAGGAAYLAPGAIWRKVVAALLALFLAPAVVFGAYYVLYTTVLPAVHPLTIHVYNLWPVLSMIPTLAIIGYSSIRQKTSTANYYWLTTPVLAALFVACFWPAHSYIGMTLVIATAVALSVLAFLGRTGDAQGIAAHRTFLAATAVGGVFCLVYFVSNVSQTIYDYQMANAVSITEIDASALDATNNNRLVPRLAASDYCAGNNQETITTISKTPRPIVINDGPGGASRFYWECVRHPDLAAIQNRKGLFLSHPLALTGGTQGAVLVDAGERGRYGEPIKTEFLFGEESVFAMGAFYARHPGATPQPGMIALTADQDAYVVIPFVNKELQLGSMIPDLSGVMTISSHGFIQDLLPSQAAAKFPGVAFVPSDLARQYADLWAHDSSFWAKHITGNQLELSENPTDAGNANASPYWQDFKHWGLKGVVNFEPIGTQQNSWVRIGLFDRASLSMTVVQIESLNLTGTKQLVLNAANASHPGLFNVTARDPLISVSKNHCIYVLAALMQQTNPAYHGYSRNTLADGHGQHYDDVDSQADVDKILDNLDSSCAAPGNAGK